VPLGLDVPVRPDSMRPDSSLDDLLDFDDEE
jgi:hypothetical protein